MYGCDHHSCCCRGQRSVLRLASYSYREQQQGSSIRSPAGQYMSPLRRAGLPFLRARRQPPSPLLARHAVHVCRAARCWHTSAGLCSSDKPRPEPDMDSAPAVFDASGWPPAVAPYAQLSRAEKPIGTSIQELFALQYNLHTPQEAFFCSGLGRGASALQLQQHLCRMCIC